MHMQMVPRKKTVQKEGSGEVTGSILCGCMCCVFIYQKKEKIKKEYTHTCMNF